MSTNSDDALIAAGTRTMQIIGGALLIGLLSFLVLATILVQQRGGPLGQPGQVPFIALAALVFVPVQVVLWLIVPGVIAKQQLVAIAQEKADAITTPGGDTGRLLAACQTEFIIGRALLEGGGFFAAVAYLIEAHPATLTLGGVIVLLMAMSFPVRLRIEVWLDQKQRQLEELRSERSRMTG